MKVLTTIFSLNKLVYLYKVIRSVGIYLKTLVIHVFLENSASDKVVILTVLGSCRKIFNLLNEFQDFDQNNYKSFESCFT